LLLSGFLGVDYAQLLHTDPLDTGPTVVLRFTDSAPDAANAYHLVQPTLDCDGKQGLVCYQRAGSLTVFMAREILHTGSLNERGPDPDYPSLGVGLVQKTKTLTRSHARRHLLAHAVCFDVIDKYSKA
jgi:hypothetical protein